ncbi:hypothetical protein JK364_26375 [Streptomyces sp. 110]|uniref:DUF4244 domain-containing protein n=1 Tax=Streptomyces endocoffeicus TaxID=2898945 RepID=A0ABS1PUD7_9ACTN|nr:hypothetical protein [Streptomyces endocoffeicus]MBL1115904.1 hypothetical protein [Streptomyces endocoffeicus]
MSSEISRIGRCSGDDGPDTIVDIIFPCSEGAAMDPLLAAAACGVVTLLIVSGAAVLVVRSALGGAESRDRARILGAVAEVVRAVRGKR